MCVLWFTQHEWLVWWKDIKKEEVRIFVKNFSALVKAMPYRRQFSDSPHLHTEELHALYKFQQKLHVRQLRASRGRSTYHNKGQCHLVPTFLHVDRVERSCESSCQHVYLQYLKYIFCQTMAVATTLWKLSNVKVGDLMLTRWWH